MDKIVYVEFVRAICMNDKGDEWYVSGVHETPEDAQKSLQLGLECGLDVYYQPIKIGIDRYPIRVGDKDWIVCGITPQGGQ